MADIDVSLIVCTRDRLESLRTTLASLESLVVPTGWTTELVVVDDGSTDGTAEFLAEMRSRFSVRVVEGREPGLSRARNAAMRHARGRVFVWTDDDVVVDRDWLWRMATPILDGVADAVAGRVIIPEELKRHIPGTPFERRLGMLAATDWSYWRKPPRMVGASMAFGAHVLSKVPAFDERLGAGEKSLGFHEETLFCWQLLDVGYRLVGAPDAFVHHHFDVTRLDADSYRRIGARFGRSGACVDWHWHHRPPIRFLGFRGARILLRQRLGRFLSDAAGALEFDFQEAVSRAYFDEYSRCMRQPRKYTRTTKSDT